ncbi:MAG: EamA family transporter [Candidatus Lambdaproteobacteria bacterium]|nr:EamA family transporter [Candidatus Lambdaproteobacteria bacterium]
MRPYLAGVGAILCWASLAAVIGQGLHSLPPEQLLCYGLTIAALGLCAWHWWHWGRPLPPWPGWRVALLGVYGIWGFHTLLVLALSLAPQVPANILNYTWPLWIVLLGALLPGQRLRQPMLLAALLGFAGVMAVIGGGWPGAPAADDTLPVGSPSALVGLLLALCAGFCWGSFSVLLRGRVPPRRQYMGLFCALSAGVAALVLALRGGPWTVTPAQMGLLAYLGLVPLGASFLLWEYALKGGNVQVLGVLSFFTPLLSTLLLALVGGEPPGLSALAGLALILAGSALAAWSGRTRLPAR